MPRQPIMLVDKNPDHWKLGVFYYNPEGPLFVRKRTRLGGFTVNLARPLGAATLLVPLAIVIAGAVLAAAHRMR